MMAMISKYELLKFLEKMHFKNKIHLDYSDTSSGLIKGWQFSVKSRRFLSLQPPTDLC
jgi:hypothetical protein